MLCSACPWSICHQGSPKRGREESLSDVTAKEVFLEAFRWAEGSPHRRLRGAWPAEWSLGDESDRADLSQIASFRALIV